MPPRMTFAGQRQAFASQNDNFYVRNQMKNIKGGILDSGVANGRLYWQFSLLLSFSRFVGRSLFLFGCSRVGVAFIVAFGYAPSSLASDKHSLVKMITFMSEIK